MIQKDVKKIRQTFGFRCLLMPLAIICADPSPATPDFTEINSQTRYWMIMMTGLP